MAEKILNTRIQLKYDSWANWNNTTVAKQGGNLVLKEGEIAICEIPASAGQVASEPAIIFKVGNGTNAFKDLPWASAKAADVYNWAKCGYVELDANQQLKFYNIADDGEGESIAKIIDFSRFALANKVYSKDDIDGLLAELDTGVTSIAAADKSIAINNAVSSQPQIAVNFADEAGNVDFEITEGGIVANVNQNAIKNIKVNEAITAETATLADTANKVANALTIKVNGTSKGSFDGSETKSINLSASDFGLSGAMKFLGVSDSIITDGGSEALTINGTSTPIDELSVGSVVIYQNQEFVVISTLDTDVGEEVHCWELLGDEGSYALNSISITGNNGLEGGGNLRDHRTIGIAAGGVTSEKIAADAVTGVHILDGSVDADILATNAVTTAKIKDGAVTKDKIENGAITEDKIAEDAITTDKISVNAVQSTNLGLKAVTTAKIADNAVGAAQLKSVQGYTGDDAEVWVFCCGSSTELI